MHLDWSHWLYSLGSALIGGGAGAASAGVTAALQTPDHYNLGHSPHGLRHLLFLMIGTFLINGFIAAFFFLKQSPLPPVEPNDAPKV